MEWKNKPFNDVVDYFNKVEGNASNIGKADKKRFRHSDAPKNLVSQNVSQKKFKSIYRNED